MVGDEAVEGIVTRSRVFVGSILWINRVVEAVSQLLHTFQIGHTILLKHVVARSESCELEVAVLWISHVIVLNSGVDTKCIVCPVYRVGTYAVRLVNVVLERVVKMASHERLHEEGDG
jgi:hypothetical protein